MAIQSMGKSHVVDIFGHFVVASILLSSVRNTLKGNSDCIVKQLSKTPHYVSALCGVQQF